MEKTPKILNHSNSSQNMDSVKVRDEFTTSAEVRDELIDELRKYMIGPHWGNDEVIDTVPKFTYLTGILYPQDSQVEEENLSHEEHDPTHEEEVPDNTSINSLNLSSFGLTCMLEIETNEITINVDYGIYSSKKIVLPNGKKKTLHKRTHFEQQELISIPDKVESDETIPLEIKFGELRVYFKQTTDGILCSVYMINTYQTHTPSSKNIIFQPTLEIYSEKNQIKHNIPKDFSKVKGSDESLFDLIFDSKKNFGFGHGTSVNWDDSNIVGKNIGRINTDFLPKFTQEKIEPTSPESFSNSSEVKSCVNMKKLSEVIDYTQYKDMLSIFPKLYSDWITAELKLNLENILDKKTGEIQIKRCQDALKRIEEGIQIISTDSTAGKAFQFMNKVMSIQRLCSENVEKNIEINEFYPPILENASGEWRLFQLGFILMNIKSFLSEKNTAKQLDDNDVDENSIRQSRETADLLWFPTGGGKTEAYLGIIAFVLAMRRLSASKFPNFDGDLEPGPEAFGTSVLMRYTLRLLTVQQFQRAASLMCACEYVRRKEPETWGRMQFLVGLWVGQASTPNQLMGKDNYTSAEYTILNSRKYHRTPEQHNPMQLLNCPWCGDKLNADNYDLYKDAEFNLPERMRCYCLNDKCDFNKNRLRLNPKTKSADTEVCLPILTVDSDIYNWCPSLLISTVDKFAQIAYNSNVGNIFGKINKFCHQHGFRNTDKEKNGGHKETKKIEPSHTYFTIENLLPPDLIVQDELHLISGPMGTLTALYETAIDYFCKNTVRDMRPKIIASTATTKSADTQIETLFNRKTDVFPPQGFEFGNTFFSSTNPNASGKIFLGISPTARSPITTLAMTSASIMRRVRYLKEEKKIDDSVLDPYYTLISYFNSKRELGGAYGTYSDTVPDYFSQIMENIEDRKIYEDEDHE